MNENKPEKFKETCQVGTTLVQVSTRLIKPGSEPDNRVRLGRPARLTPAKLSKLTGGANAVMSALLQRAFAEAAKLSEAEQEVLASRLLAELARKDDLDPANAGSSDKLPPLASSDALSEQSSK